MILENVVILDVAWNSNCLDSSSALCGLSSFQLVWRFYSAQLGTFELTMNYALLTWLEREREGDTGKGRVIN